MKNLFAVAALLLCAIGVQAQAPPSLPGFGVSMSAGYTSVSGQPLGNGLFASFAAPVYTNPGFSSGPLKNDAFTVAARIDNFNLPNSNSIFLGSEGRFQFSKANFMDGQIFQPFFYLGLGGVRSSCVAAMDCAAGSDTATHFGAEFSAGIDMITSTHVVWRALQYSRIESRFYPNGGVTLSNANQLITGLTFKF